MYTQRFDLDRLEMGPSDYDGVVAYARAKRAQVVLADAWAHRFAAAGVASFAMHPGWVDTPGLEAGLPRFRSAVAALLRTPAQGADTVVWLAAGGPAAEATPRGRRWRRRGSSTIGEAAPTIDSRSSIRHTPATATRCWPGVRPAPASRPTVAVQ